MGLCQRNFPNHVTSYCLSPVSDLSFWFDIRCFPKYSLGCINDFIYLVKGEYKHSMEWQVASTVSLAKQCGSTAPLFKN